MVDPNDATLSPVWTALRILLLAGGVELLNLGFSAKSPAYHWTMVAAGAVSTIGPVAWGLYVAVTHAARAIRDRAKNVQAGINLVTSGQAVAADGHALVVVNPSGGSVAPLPVTKESAAEIAKTFAPVVAAR